MINIAQVLRDARALIDTPDKWIKGCNERDGCMCVLGAIAKVSGTLPNFLHHYFNISAIKPFVPDGFDTVHQFNDHPDTTHADVMALFDRAIAAAELEAQS